MSVFKDRVRRVALGMFVAVTALLSGCASTYLDTGTKTVPTAQFKKPASPGPVQLLFEFQTKGVANAQASQALREQVTAQVKASGLFSEIGSAAVPNGAMLSITVNNVPMSDDAFTKGFLTGFTFGLAGSQVGDGYVCTASYRGPGSTAPLVKQTRHAIYTTLGAAGAPSNGTKMPSAKDAVQQMMTDVVSNVLNDLSQDAAFK